MSPIITFIALLAIAGVGLLVVGLLKRRWSFVLIGVPCAALLVYWFVGAGKVPDAEAEFALCFGKENRVVASDIVVTKPRSMDGHFITFKIAPADYNARFAARFSKLTEKPGRILERQELPQGWPAWVADVPTAVEGELGYRRVFVVYGPKEQRVYASVEYPQW